MAVMAQVPFGSRYGATKRRCLHRPYSVLDPSSNDWMKTLRFPRISKIVFGLARLGAKVTLVASTIVAEAMIFFRV